MSSQVKTINILGATGSIGRSAADVIAAAPERFDVLCVTACDDADGLAEIALRLRARRAVLANPRNFEILRARLGSTGVEISCGRRALEEAAGAPADVTLAAIVGMAGLAPVMNAITGSRAVALANKEPLVAAGLIMMEAAARRGTKILPVDSEHNAVFQVFDSGNPDAVEKIVLTASGGPFRAATLDEMRRATPAQALAHPNWSMGKKISIDSATMMNKALEVIEAHYLFGLPSEKIEVLVHPQSIVHSMVEYRDGSVLAQMAASDMRTPLANVLAWPDRLSTPGARLDLKNIAALTFEPPDEARFPALKLAREALRAGPWACVALNATNEVAVGAFLAGRIGFLDIAACAAHSLETAPPGHLRDIGDVTGLDGEIRQRAMDYIAGISMRGRVAAL